MDAMSLVLSRLEDLGFDGEAMNVRCLVDSPGENAEGLGEVLLELESLAASGRDVPADFAALNSTLGDTARNHAAFDNTGAAFLPVGI